MGECRNTILAINSTGNGFLTEFKYKEINKILKDLYFLLKNKLTIKFFPIYKALINNNKYYFVNDLVIINPIKAMMPQIKINNILFSSSLITGYNFCSSIGSFGFNKSLTGPLILDFEQKNIIITPIAPINNSTYYSVVSPVVINFEHSDINIDIKNNHLDNNNFIVIDGVHIKEKFEHIIIKKSKKIVSFFLKKDKTINNNNINKYIIKKIQHKFLVGMIWNKKK